MTILEDLKSGRLVVVPREALADLCNAVMADISEAKRRLDADIPKDAPVHPVSAFLTGTALHVGKARASPDHTAGLIALVEGMEKTNKFMKAAYESLAATSDSNFSKWEAAEARALTAEAERDAQSQTATRYANELSETRAGAIEANGLKGLWMDRALAAEAERDEAMKAAGEMDECQKSMFVKMKAAEARALAAEAERVRLKARIADLEERHYAD